VSRRKTGQHVESIPVSANVTDIFVIALAEFKMSTPDLPAYPYCNDKSKPVEYLRSQEQMVGCPDPFHLDTTNIT
jgi:hypothetical protein